MPLFKTILFAADFSESSRAAFRIACSLAREGETRLLILHVLEEVHIVEEPVYFGQQKIEYSTVAKGQGYQESVKDRLRRSYVPDRALETEYLTRDGLPTEEILRAAEDAGADLIAMGTHGRVGLSRVLTGSVAEAVLRGARCPVLALRSPDRARGLAPEVRCILAPIDTSEHSQHAARVARELARELGAKLVLLQVAPMEVVTGEIVMPVDLHAYRESLEAMRAKLDGPDLKSPVKVVLRQGDSPSEILAVADTMDCDLIVMGTHGRSGLLRFLVGSVAEAVLRGSNCPVLTVKTAAPIKESTSEAGMSARAPSAQGEGALTAPIDSSAGDQL